MHPNSDNTSSGGGGGGTGSSEVAPDTSSSADSPQRFCLRWNNHQTNLVNVFDQLLQNGWFVDVTLACDGRSVQAHKVVLSACSPYFQALFTDNPCQHPIVILKDILYPELKAVVEFMYKGEINVAQEQIGPLLRVAETLKIRGLAEINNEPDLSGKTGAQSGAQPLSPNDSANSRSQSRASNPGGVPPPRKRRRRSMERSPEGQNHLSESPAKPMGLPSPSQTPVNLGVLPLPPSTAQSQPQQQTQQQCRDVMEDLDIKPGIAEMIREEERAKKLESSQAWLCASTSATPSAADAAKLPASASPPALKLKGPSWSQQAQLQDASPPGLKLKAAPWPQQAQLQDSSPPALKLKASSWPQQAQLPDASPPALKLKTPTWSQSQLQEAIHAVVTQQMRFTTAAARYGIPKGTLYDNILGKTKRMMILEKTGLTIEEEAHVLEFCCEISVSPYNRRTRKSLAEILTFVTDLRRRREPDFAFEGLGGFRWWWAFCKKHCIVSLYFESPQSGPCSPAGGLSEIDENHVDGFNGSGLETPPPRFKPEKLCFDLEPLSAINYSTKNRREDRVVFGDSHIETEANSYGSSGYFKD